MVGRCDIARCNRLYARICRLVLIEWPRWHQSSFEYGISTDATIERFTRMAGREAMLQTVRVRTVATEVGLQLLDLTTRMVTLYLWR